MDTQRGYFITVEGGDGAGKTTQLTFLRDYLEKEGMDVLFTREPGGTQIGEALREVILDPAHHEMAPMTEMLLYAASRAQIVEEVIRPALEQGTTVVCDRYVDSSIAYQGYARGLGDCVATVNSFAIGGLVPDLTILLKADPACSRARRTDRAPEEDGDRIEQAGDAFHQKVYEGYLALEKQFPQRIVGIDATQSIEAVSAAIAHHLDALFAGPPGGATPR